jgi:hypothetical protein
VLKKLAWMLFNAWSFSAASQPKGLLWWPKTSLWCQESYWFSWGFSGSPIFASMQSQYSSISPVMLSNFMRQLTACLRKFRFF